MEEDKSLDLLKEKALAVPKIIPGIEDFPDSSVTIPRLIIGQPGNLSGYAEGRFINNLTMEDYQELDVVLLKFSRSRTLWPAGQPKLGDVPECKAQDAKVPDHNFYGRPCNRCDDVHQLCVDELEKPICQHAKFTKLGRPDCRLIYHLLIVTIPNADMFILSLTGRGISPTNRLISNFKIKGMPPFSARFVLSLDKAADGNFYTIKYTNFAWLESKDELRSLFERFQKTSITPTKEESNGTE